LFSSLYSLANNFLGEQTCAIEYPVEGYDRYGKGGGNYDDFVVQVMVAEPES
jgi:hypothetical protein